jgi:hypothetical protein
MNDVVLPWVRRHPTKSLLLASSAAVVLGISVWSFYGFHHQFHYLYERLRLGMTRSEVEAVMGGPARCETRVGGATVLYFIDPSYDGGPGCAQVASAYRVPSELPWLYSAMQVALDRSGRVSAFVQMGDSSAQTRVASKPGGTLAPLPLEALE